MIVTAIVVIWVVCGLIAAGFQNAYYQRRWPYLPRENELWTALGLGIVFGPIALYVNSRDYSDYGWSLRYDAVKK